MPLALCREGLLDFDLCKLIDWTNRESQAFVLLKNDCLPFLPVS